MKRVEPAIVALLRSGFIGSKHDIAAKVHAAVSGVQPCLAQLESAGKVRVCMWVRNGNSESAIYEYMNGRPSLPRPVPRKYIYPQPDDM